MNQEDKKIKQVRKKSKFECFQNLKENKFSAYKYERNVFISVNNQSEIDQQEYLQPEQIKNNNKEITPLQIQKQTFEQGVDNLWQLWNQIGQQQMKVSELTDVKSKDQNQLTEQQLLQCFGEQNYESSNQNEINKLTFQNKQQINKIENKSIVQKGQNQQKDFDLMDIWGQTSQHLNSQSTQQIFNQNKIQKNNNSRKKQTVQQKYDWQQQKSKAYNDKKKQNILTNQNNPNSQCEDYFEMELQDPNFISLKYRHTHQNQKKQNSSPIQGHVQKDSLQPQQKIISTSNTYNIYQNSKQSHLNQQHNDTPLKNTESKGLSIINQILIESNAKQMNKLIPGKHYQIFDTKNFVLNPFKQNTYSYFGIEAQNSSLIQSSLKLEKYHTFYLYSFQTKEAFLELRPEPFDKSYVEFLSVKKAVSIGPGQKSIKSIMEYKTDLCYKIRLCSTKQHIATLFYKVIKNGYLYDLRLFDQYENMHSQPIALIQVKDGYVNDCCYCDTNVFIEKGYLNNPILSFRMEKPKFQIEKLKMILNLKNGKLTANMGIGGIESSPFNCCLQNQGTLKFIYLMGLLLENSSQQIHFENIPQNYQNRDIKKQKNKNSFIIKVGEGVTPLVGLAIAAGRKIYIDSFQ